jgi:hypothetical protein
MATEETTTIEIPTALATDLEARAKAMGLILAAYLSFLLRVGSRQHDAEFISAAKYLFSKYPAALRELVQ